MNWIERHHVLVKFCILLCLVVAVGVAVIWDCAAAVFSAIILLVCGGLGTYAIVGVLYDLLVWVVKGGDW